MVLVAPTIKKIWPCIQRSKYGWWRLELSKNRKKTHYCNTGSKCENKNTKTKPKTHAKEIMVKNKAKCKKFFLGTEKEGNTNAPKKSCEAKIREKLDLAKSKSKNTLCEDKIAPNWILCNKIQKVTFLIHSETGW